MVEVKERETLERAKRLFVFCDQKLKRENTLHCDTQKYSLVSIFLIVFVFLVFIFLSFFLVFFLLSLFLAAVVVLLLSLEALLRKGGKDL